MRPVSAQGKERHSFSAGRNASCPSTLCGLDSLFPALSSFEFQIDLSKKIENIISPLMAGAEKAGAST
jgi:hypothetical protein